MMDIDNVKVDKTVLNKQELLKLKVDTEKSKFSYSDCKSVPSRKSKLMTRSILYAIIVIMLALYCYSIFVHIKYKLGIGSLIGAALPICFGCFFLILSAHNLWGKLVSFVLKHESLQSRGFRRNRANIEDVAQSE